MPRPAPAGDRDTAIAELYLRDGVSIRQIARQLEMSRVSVRDALRRQGADVRPRGAGRARPHTRFEDPADLEEQLRTLYCEQRLTRAEIAARLGLTEGLVRSRLDEYGIRMRTRGRGNREDRRDVDLATLVALYARRGLSATAIGERLGIAHTVVLRAAHEQGLAVRPGAAAPLDAEIRLVEALYADPHVARTLARHGVPAVPPGAPIWQRFPEPVPLTDALLGELYADCGVSIAHIELLTGQPAATVRRHLHRAGVPLRPAGGRCPFLQRWHQRHHGALPSTAPPPTGGQPVRAASGSPKIRA